MDVKLLYKITERLKNEVVTIPFENNEWFHFGTDLENPFETLKTLIENHVGLHSVYIVTNRKDSKQLTFNELISLVNSSAGKNNFYLWNENLNKVLEFKNIGVLRKGYIPKENFPEFYKQFLIL